MVADHPGDAKEPQRPNRKRRRQLNKDGHRVHGIVYLSLETGLAHIKGEET